MVQSSVIDVVNDLNGVSGASNTYVIYNAVISSGNIYDAILEADGYLRGWVGNGPSTSTNSLTLDQVKRFEVNYAAMKTLMKVEGIITTDGHNFALGGTAIQRTQAQSNTFQSEITKRKDLVDQYIKMLHEWFIVYNPNFPQGFNENGNPISYWSTASQRY